MSNIVDSQNTKTHSAGEQATPSQVADTPDTPRLLKGIWVVTVLLWPILKWVVAIDCVFKLSLAIYHWDTPGTHAGWTFLLHFAGLTALTYYVSIYKPKGL